MTIFIYTDSLDWMMPWVNKTRETKWRLSKWTEGKNNSTSEGRHFWEHEIVKHRAEYILIKIKKIHEMFNFSGFKLLLCLDIFRIRILSYGYYPCRIRVQKKKTHSLINYVETLQSFSAAIFIFSWRISYWLYCAFWIEVNDNIFSSSTLQNQFDGFFERA